MRRSGIAAFLVLVSGCVLADTRAMSIDEFRSGLSDGDVARLRTTEERLVELDPYLATPRTIFRLNAEPYVALSFKLSDAGQVSDVKVVATNLDQTQDGSFIANCKKALAISKFKKIGPQSSTPAQAALLILRFQDPWKR